MHSDAVLFLLFYFLCTVQLSPHAIVIFWIYGMQCMWCVCVCVCVCVYVCVCVCIVKKLCSEILNPVYVTY